MKHWHRHILYIESEALTQTHFIQSEANSSFQLENTTLTKIWTHTSMFYIPYWVTNSWTDLLGYSSSTYPHTKRENRDSIETETARAQKTDSKKEWQTRTHWNPNLFISFQRYPASWEQHLPGITNEQHPLSLSSLIFFSFTQNDRHTQKRAEAKQTPTSCSLVSEVSTVVPASRERRLPGMSDILRVLLPAATVLTSTGGIRAHT